MYVVNRPAFLASLTILSLFSFFGGVSALGEERVITFPTESDLDHPAFAWLGQTAVASQHIGQVNDQIIFDTTTTTTTTDEKKETEHDLFILASSSHGHATPLLLDSRDDQAIHVAAQTFARDVYKVTGQRPKLYNDTLPKGVERALVVGSVTSRLIKGVREQSPQQTAREGLEGKWESYDVRWEEEPVKGLKEGLVVTGSDRRGTIYALYTLSEQTGVSPFHFWTDTPIRPHSAVAYSRTKSLTHGEPTVKYRGLFINDEHPAMWGWAQQRWGRKPWEPALQVEMYEEWFEMMLRLKSNYHWPAMWASMFDVDGLDVSSGLPKSPTPGPNQVLANRMGIVMGTSHHEPMSRNKPEWDAYGSGAWDWTNNSTLTKFWEYGAERAKGMETLFTMGMRGDGDSPLTGASNELVQNITHAQQEILKDVYDTDDLSKIGQVWCMYKEVGGYYVNGLEVPEDVTVLFADDNWGNINSVLPPERQGHKAGAGIYYHVDYVGAPRDYKWINTINLAKTWEQMNVARAFNTTQIWILNVGSLKPLEMPSEWFLNLAYDSDAWSRNSVGRFLREWAGREFGEEWKDEVGDIMARYSVYASRRKAEIVDSNTFSLINYGEAERVLAEWDDLTHRAGKVYDQLPKDTKPAFFQSVYMLCAAQANLNRLHMAVGRSNLYAFQARTAANVFAQQAIEAFYQDANLTETFHSLLNRKWDHMWDQTHINYFATLEPIRDSLPPVRFVNPYQPSRPGIPIKEHAVAGHVAYIRLTVENLYGAWPGDTGFNCELGYKCPDPTVFPLDPYGAQTRWVDVGAGGPRNTSFKIKSDEKWLKVSQDRGKVKWDGSEDVRIYISVDWDKVDTSSSAKVIKGEDGVSKTEGHLLFQADDHTNVTVTVPIIIPPSPPGDFHGHVQGDGYVVMEARHFSRNTSVEGYAYEEIEWYGRTISGLEMFPVSTKNFTLGQGPKLEYDFWSHDTSDSLVNLNDEDEGEATVEVIVQIGPSNNFILGKQLTLGVQLDSLPPTEVHPIPLGDLGDDQRKGEVGAVPKDWFDVVMNEIRNVTLSIPVKDEDTWKEAGKHTVSIWGMSAGIVIERIWVDLGGIKERGYSYLGPPESIRV
ncbi:hypothetical protein CI109_104906 [Kwoniella shandongensis]|uniref:Uncharacterized protein n=1 Tax=Kwoniella shandongensis TaxID=1734106 RepID=A0A5M6BQP6_9TREE|nr:uncharacterized protein CI109_006624 [Kwoniella shandongensis]KAA5525073.1 hypothetical protein CI109_006624 [Kwoniella shandongensis]